MLETSKIIAGYLVQFAASTAKPNLFGKILLCNEKDMKIVPYYELLKRIKALTTEHVSHHI